MLMKAVFDLAIFDGVAFDAPEEERILGIVSRIVTAHTIKMMWGNIELEEIKEDW